MRTCRDKFLDFVRYVDMQNQTFKIITEKGVVVVYPAGVFHHQLVKNTQKFKEKSDGEWVKLFFAVIFSWIRNPISILQEVSTQTNEAAIPVSAFYSVFGKVFPMKPDGTLGIIPEIVSNNKERFIHSKKIKTFFFSIIAGLCFITAYSLRKHISRLEQIQKKAEVEKDFLCIICRTDTVKKMLLPCLHICVCDACVYINCPKCLDLVQGFTPIRY